MNTKTGIYAICILGYILLVIALVTSGCGGSDCEELKGGVVLDEMMDSFDRINLILGYACCKCPELECEMEDGYLHTYEDGTTVDMDCDYYLRAFEELKEKEGLK